MTLWQSILLGVIQGLTEYLPISSTAHLRIVPAVLGWPDPGAAFTAVIQLGTLVAVLLYFARDIIEITRDLFRNGPRAKQGWMIALGTVPVIVVGLLFKDHIETTLRSLYVIAAAMIALAVVLAVAEMFERRRQQLRGLNDLGWWDAMVVGLCQAVALIPGSSRSGCTMTGGLFLGMSRDTAARFSFLLSLPAILAAGVFELKELQHANTAGWTNTVVATAVSFLVGYASIAFLLGYLKKHTMWVFIIYRLVAGAVLLALLRAGWLQP